MKKYSEIKLQKMYDEAKWYLFIPLIGFFIYMKNVMVLGKEAGLMDKTTPGGKYMDSLTKKFFMYTNIFILPWSLFVALMFNFMFFFWRVKTRECMKMNKEAGLY